MDAALYPCLWFDGNAREAADFYVGLFPDSRIVHDNGLVVIWEMRGQRFMGLNGGPAFSFTEAVSFVVSCANQAEIDHYWDAFTSNGGSESMCCWCKDRFGLSWQVVPDQLGQWMMDPQRGKAVRELLLTMRKPSYHQLQNAS